MGLIDWLKNKYNEGFSIWSVVITLVICFVVYVLGKSFDADLTEPFLSKWWFFGAAVELSKLLATSIIAGGVLKVLATEKFFTSALSEIVYGERGLDIMLPARRLELWKSLTKRIYVPSAHLSLGKNDAEDLYRDVVEVSGQEINYSEDLFIRNIHREMEFKWVDDNVRDKFFVKDYMTAVLVPFDETKSIQWMSKRIKGQGEDINSVVINKDETMIDGKPPNIVSKKISDDKTTETTIFELKDRRQYTIVRTREQTLPKDEDDLYIVRSPYITWGGDIKITNNMKDTILIFNSVGTMDMFNNVVGKSNVVREGQHIRRQIKNVLLPRRGFIINFISPVAPADFPKKGG